MTGKAFFSKEKKQKTFMSLSRGYPAAYAFSKKLLAVPLSRPAPVMQRRRVVRHDREQNCLSRSR
jgi:hypothetical protein